MKFYKIIRTPWGEDPLAPTQNRSRIKWFTFIKRVSSDQTANAFAGEDSRLLISSFTQSRHE